MGIGKNWLRSWKNAFAWCKSSGCILILRAGEGIETSSGVPNPSICSTKWFYCKVEMGCQLQQNTSERIKLENIYIHILREQYQQTFPKQKSTDYLRLVCMSGTSAECWIQELTPLLLEVPGLPATYHPCNLSLKTSLCFWQQCLNHC